VKMGIFSKIKEKISGGEEKLLEEAEEYIELGPEVPEKDQKIIIRPFTLEEFEDVKPILDALREGRTVALVNIEPLKNKDLVELKRAISKLKKTCEAIEGDIAGFGDNYLVAVPSFGEIYKAEKPEDSGEGNA